MPNLTETITNFVCGNDLEIRKTITGIPAGQTLTRAWFTVKLKESDPDLSAYIQKIVTITDVVGTGHITDNGATDQIGEVRFDLLPTDTEDIHTRNFFWDIKVKTSANKFYTPFKGTMKGVKPITISTA